MHIRTVVFMLLTGMLTCPIAMGAVAHPAATAGVVSISSSETFAAGGTEGKQTPASAASATPTGAHTGDWIAKHIAVTFGPLPPGWVAEQNVMDEVWKPLGLRGVNFYAYGGKAATNSYSMRSDPDSPFYQAWFGVYVVGGQGAADAVTASKLGDLDQASWLAAMGDPHPLGLAKVRLHRLGTISIAGVERPLFEFAGRSHSDLSAATTSLVRHLGPAPAALWRGRLAPFHDLELRGYFAFWRDPSRNLTVIAYTAAPVFALPSGARHDGFRQLDPQLRKMLHEVRLADVPVRSQKQP